MKIAGVRFRDNWRVYDFDATDVDLAVGDPVIVESDRGLGFARVMRFREADELPFAPPPAPEQQSTPNGKQKEADEDEEIEIDVETPGDAAAAAASAVTAAAPPAAAADRPKPSSKGHRKVIRKATEDDIRKEEKNQEREAEAFKSCQEMIAERELPMKLIRADYSFDGSRVTFYFFSENRVDFRELVKDLAHKLRSRIEMRQVGVRDVARIIGGFGPCGRELCCTSYLRGFEPVSIRMAKKQDMVLNPAKISGVCGRLLCCLSYEYGMYDAIKKDIVEMKEAVVREKREEEDRRLSDQRQDAEERRLAEEKMRREDERQRQERQREKQKQQPQPQQREGRKPEQKKEGGQDQKQRPPQEQQRDKQRQQPQQQQQQQQQQKQHHQHPQQLQKQQQKPGPESTTQEQAQEGQAQPQGERAGGNRKRRFWRNRKKKKGGGEGPQTPGGPPSQG
jgi:cell fate regulator YaaT (PSP1 superfamily)